jgi:DNA-binding beta-propeller fold protein YncE
LQAVKKGMVINMKKIIAVILLLCMMQLPTPVRASEGTTYTYTISLNGNWIRTQDAYLPGQVYLLGAGLKKPADLFIKGDLIYISDTGNSRIAVFNKVTGEITYLGDKILKSPRGIFVDALGDIYVADYDAECVFELSKDGEVLNAIGRPDNYLFSPRSRFKPTGVAVTSGDII